MENGLIKQRIYELTKKEHLDSASNELLLRQYHEDKLHNIPPQESEARELLIMGNEKLVFRIMHDKFGLYELNKDVEEYSVGMMGLIRAVDTFDIERNVTFSTYVTQVIINQIRMEYRKRKQTNPLLSKTSSINDPVGNYSNGDVFFLEDYLGEEDDTTEVIIHEQNIQTLKNNLQYLKADEQVSVVYGFGLFGNKKLKQNEIAKILGVNQGHVSRMMKSGQDKLKILVTPNSELEPKDLELKQKLLNRNVVEEDCNLKVLEVN